MLANETDDARALTDEELALQAVHEKWREYQAQKLDAHFAPLIEAAPKEWHAASPETFKWWHVLVTAPNRERIAAERLERVKTLIYFPNFTEQVNFRGRAHVPRMRACIPGLLFAPIEIMAIGRRDETFEWAGVRHFYRTSDGYPERVSEAEIGKVRLMEAKLNLPPEAKGVLFQVGEAVKFTGIYAGWGKAKILEIASEARISVKVEQLFGCPRPIWVSASEIEAM